MPVLDNPDPKPLRTSPVASHYTVLFDGRAISHVQPTVYGLADPDHPTVIRYVGKTDVPLRRYLSHLWRGGRRAVTARERWLRAMWLDGKDPTMVLLEACEPDALAVTEQDWTVRLRLIGQADLNVKAAPSR